MDISSKKRVIALTMSVLLSGCATGQSDYAGTPPIENPFSAFEAPVSGVPSTGSGYTLRTKRGDQAVELDLPQSVGEDLVFPMNPNFISNERAPASEGIDLRYQETKSVPADHEILSQFKTMRNAEDEAKKREIEKQLGLQTSEEYPQQEGSYLAKMDVVKQLFKSGRYEASVIEIDRLLKDYPTSAKLYEMRGTCLDRMGYGTLALQSWKQAFELDSSQISLKKWIEKKEAQRGIASEKK